MLARAGVVTGVVALVVACGGSTVSIGDPEGSSSGSSGTSGTSGSSNSPDPCSNAACDDIACPYGSTTPSGQCCPVCNPKPGTCAWNPSDSCTNKKGCSAGYERYEYGPGCCACRLTVCSTAGACVDGTTCPPGQHPAPAGCCGACTVTGECKDNSAPCKHFVCPPGYKPYGDGTCCSSCEPDPSTCADKKKAYEAWEATYIEQQNALKCTFDTDCMVQNLSNKCAGDCGTALAKVKAEEVAKAATAYGNQYCSTCPPDPIACPGVVLVAKCNQGKCQLFP